MFNLFDVVPFNFFQIFNSKSRHVYSEILFLLYFRCEEENSYTFSKEDFIGIIEDFFNSSKIEFIDEEDSSVNTSRGKANSVFRDLKKWGWIDTEFVNNGMVNINFEDYAISFLSTYAHFDSGSDIELSSYVFRIYKNLIDIGEDRIYFVLRDTLEQSTNLLRKLRSLNSNIKKYTKKIIKFSGTEDEQLKSILDQLLHDYKVKIIDNAYYYMKTNDNPSKYKSRFKLKCEEIRNGKLKEFAILEIKREEGLNDEEANVKFSEILDFLYYVFDKIIQIVLEIDSKNTKYINVATERIRILLNHDVNIEGQLLNILKNFNILSDDDICLSFSDNKNIMESSLYTPRTAINVKSSPIIKNKKVDEKLTYEFLSQMEYSKQFSQKSIKDYINNLLGQKNRLTIQDFNLKDNVLFAKLILTLVYSELNGDSYKITWEKGSKVVDEVKIPNFTIERNDN